MTETRQKTINFWRFYSPCQPSSLFTETDHLRKKENNNNTTININKTTNTNSNINSNHVYYDPNVMPSIVRQMNLWGVKNEHCSGLNGGVGGCGGDVIGGSCGVVRVGELSMDSGVVIVGGTNVETRMPPAESLSNR